VIASRPQRTHPISQPLPLELDLEMTTSKVSPPTTTPPPAAAGKIESPDRLLAPYKRADDRKALFQLVTTAALFAGMWFLMWRSLAGPYWLTLLLALPTAGLSIRLFIFQHDCGHGSFFSTRRANDAVGRVLGVVTLIPYTYWRRTHAIHHATAGNLDRREFGDVATLTVKEYLARPWHRRIAYRLYRNSLVLFFIGPAYQFILKNRFPFDTPREWKREWRSVMLTNLALAGVVAVAWATIGIGSFIAVQLPITLIAGTVGIWLFYIQHQFEDTYWESGDGWSFHSAGLEGSSFYDLPKVLHWFTGNIGYHHIHHLSSKIPNYRLRQCMIENPELQDAPRLTLWQSFKCARLKLWDEELRRLVTFRRLRQLRSLAAADGASG